MGLVVFQQLRKLQLKSREGWGNFVLFLYLFLSLHIVLTNFLYKINFHKSLIIISANLLSSITLLFFSPLQGHCFLSLIFLYIFNKYQFSLWQCLVFCLIFQFKKELTNINAPLSEIQILFQNYKLIYTDKKPRMLKASFLLELLLNN